MDKKSLSHTAWKCQYHIVFIPKYRKKNLYGQVRADVREIIRTLCNYKGVEIVEGAVCADHVHLCVCIPPKMSVSSFMGYLKGKSTLMMDELITPDARPENFCVGYVDGEAACTYFNTTFHSSFSMIY